MENNDQKNEEKITIANAIETFLRRGVAKNLSPKTTITYEGRLGVFQSFIGHDTYVSKINLDMIDCYALYLKENGSRNDITVYSYLRDLRTFLNYCMERGYLAKFKISLPKVDKKIKETYTDEELAVLLTKPDVDYLSRGSEYKIWVFTNFLLATGSRISSALDVRVEDLNFSSGLIQMNKTKSRKSQIIPMSSALAEVLQKYLASRQCDAGEYLFSNKSGGKADIRTYQGMLARYNRNRGIAKTSAHLYRHTFAKKWILNGGDMFRLQKILGHSDLSMVRNYVEMFGNEIAIDFNKFNPLDNILSNKTKQNSKEDLSDD